VERHHAHRTSIWAALISLVGHIDLPQSSTRRGCLPHDGIQYSSWHSRVDSVSKPTELNPHSHGHTAGGSNRIDIRVQSCRFLFFSVQYYYYSKYCVLYGTYKIGAGTRKVNIGALRIFPRFAEPVHPTLCLRVPSEMSTPYSSITLTTLYDYTLFTVFISCISSGPINGAHTFSRVGERRLSPVFPGGVLTADVAFVFSMHMMLLHLSSIKLEDLK
jgi:hypothetical protein